MMQILAKLLRWPEWLKHSPTWTVSIGGNMKVLIRILSFTSSRDRVFLWGSLFSSICAGATLPLMNIIFARLVKTFSVLTTTPPEQFRSVFMTTINEYVYVLKPNTYPPLYIIYLFIGRFLLAYTSILGFRITSLRISAAIRLCYLEALFQQPISTLDLLPAGQTTAIITVTANILQLGISERLSSLIQAFTVILTALVIGCVFSWELTLATTSGLIAIVAWYWLITPLVVSRFTQVQVLERDAAGIASEAFASIRMIAACGAEWKIVKQYDKCIDQTRMMGRSLSPILAIQHSPVFFAIFATFALCFWYAVKLYLKFKFTDVQTLVVVLMSVMTMISHLSAISVPLSAISNAIDAALIFLTIIDAPRPSIIGLHGNEVSLEADIVLDNIKFAYPARHEVKILQALNLRIPVGKTTAIVGPSGSGKSTIVALIQRWYELGGSDPVVNYLRSGRIRIGQEELDKIDLHWWRAQIGLVQQEPFLFNDTIFKNIEYGLVGTEWEFSSDDLKTQLVRKACKEAYADDFICALPEGYNTSVGDVGLRLSGGQRQRIAIARAIVRQPKILIFDEATSALDATSERIVQAALDHVAHNRTTIVIAHRLSTVKHADNIVVVANGQVAQQGTHEALLADKTGLYCRLVNAQQLAMMIVPITEGHPAAVEETGTISTEKESRETFIECETSAQESHKEQPSTSESSVLRNLVGLLIEQQQNWLGCIMIVAGAIGAAASNPLQAYLFGRLIASFAYWGAELRVLTSFLCLMLLAVAVGVGLSYFTLGWVANNISVHSVTTYRKEYFRNIISKRISFFDYPHNSIGLLTARIATDPTQLQQLLGFNMAMVLISLFSLIGCVAIAILFHWKFGLVVITGSLPIILAGGWYRVRHEVRFEVRNNQVFAESAQFATEAIGAIRTVASLTLERVVCERYNNLLANHILTSWREARLSCLVFAASDSLVLLCMAFSLWYGGTLLASSELSPFKFLVVYLAIIQGSLAAGQWLSFGPNIAQVSGAANRIHAMRVYDGEDEEILTAKYRDTNRWTLPVDVLWKGADIEFRNVWFKYPTRNVQVLRGLSMKIVHGQFAAIVGSSGSGKTTIISLLERFYEPERGDIWYNGENFASIPLRVLRKRMSLVAQEPYLLRGTIRDNILLGVKAAKVTESLLHQTCRDAGIHDFIASLPNGYDTDVGVGGVSLSGGQKQRISIARALIRNPSVLLLDEATSSLDSETEKEVQAVFERTGKGRTMIVVAHRLATVQNADIIFVMDQGVVVEQGSHRSLLNRKGMYWRMCTAQDLSV